MKNVPAPLPREERRRINEPCLWCFVESDGPKKGAILNESATGILLEAEEPLDSGKRIWILSLPGDDLSTRKMPTEELINHPLSRAGTIVRNESVKRAGVQFDREEKERPRYLRWYRGNSSVVTLTDGDRATIALSGALTFESATLLEKLFTKQNKSIREILFSCHDIEQVNNTALTVLRAALRHCDKSGVNLTIITGQAISASLEKNLPLEHGYFSSISGIPVQTASESSPAAACNETSSKSVSVQTVAPEGVVILSRGAVDLNRLANPLLRMEIPTWKTTNFKEAPDLIATHNPRFIVMDIELEHCPQLLELNRIRKYALSRVPPAMVIGPPHLGELIREALALPVKMYLIKPCTDREYATGLQAMLKEKYTSK